MPQKDKKDYLRYQSKYRDENPEKIKKIRNKSTLKRSLDLLFQDNNLTTMDKKLAGKVINKAIENMEDK